MFPQCAEPTVSYAISVIIGTYNRAIDLHGALQSLMRQTGSISFEVIVVDNASTDDTPLVARLFRDAPRPVRYICEPRPGVAFARNRGAHHATAEMYAFMDDDQIAAPDWVSVAAHTLRADPTLHFVGGRNLPPPGTQLPDWVTPDLFGALALGSGGDTVRPITRQQWMTLMGGNMACRKEVFEAVGGFRPYRRSQDRELTLRLLLAGYRGRYVPHMIMYHHVDKERLTRAHFRRWFEVEGATRARYRFLERFHQNGALLDSPVHGRRLFGVSLFVYREWLLAMVSWLRAVATARRSDAFRHELRARHLLHYIVHAARGRAVE